MRFIIHYKMVAKNESNDSELIFVVVVVVVLCFPFFVLSVLLSSIHTALLTVPFTLEVDKQGLLGCLPFTQTTGVEILRTNIKFDMVGEQPVPKYI